AFTERVDKAGKPSVAPQTAALLRKIKQLGADRALDGGLAPVELIAFRSEYNTIRQNSRDAQEKAYQAARYAVLDSKIQQALRIARRQKLTEQIDRLLAMRRELYRHSGSGSAYLTITNRPLNDAELAQQIFENVVNQSKKIYDQFVGTQQNVFDPAIERIFAPAREELEKAGGRRLEEIRGPPQEAEGLSAGNATTLRDVANLLSYKFQPAFAPSRKSSSATMKGLAAAVQKKEAVLGARLGVAPSFAAKGEAEKIEYVIGELLPLAQGLYLYGARYDRQDRAVREHAGLVSPEFASLLDRVLALRDTADADALFRATEALNGYLHKKGFHLITRVTGRGPILLSTYRERRSTTQAIRTADGRTVEVAGIVYERIDGLPEDAEAPINIAESLGNGEYVRIFEDKIRRIVQEYVFTADGREEKILDQFLSDVDRILAGRPGESKYLTGTREGTFGFNPRTHEAEFAREAAALAGRAEPNEEDRAAGEKTAFRLQGTVNRLNLLLMQAYSTGRLKKDDSKALRTLVSENLAAMKDQAALQRRIYENEFGKNPDYGTDKLRVITDGQIDMNLSHEFGHESHRLLIGEEAYAKATGAEKEYIAHLWPVANGRRGKLVFDQLFGYLSKAPDSDGWKKDYKQPALRILNDLARLAGLEGIEPNIDVFNANKQAELVKVRRLIEQLMALPEAALQGYATQLLAAAGVSVPAQARVEAVPVTAKAAPGPSDQLPIPLPPK
ncbi:MAG TPA: hypothetical protein VL404_06270, partial [Candidatus Eisenbacteria bacterium]|nr:hypothetical protein [Candidatus Eisenbacteria bacterium]